MLRIDEELSDPISEVDRDRLLDTVKTRLAEPLAVVVLSDYDKGVMTPFVCRTLIGEARHHRALVLVDPKGLDFGKYAGATALTPNRHEFEMATGVSVRHVPAFREAARQMRDGLGLDFLAVTQGEKGVTLFDDNGDQDFPAVAREVFDVSGAGDTLIATLAAGLAAGLDRGDAVQLANVAAGVVVGKVGTAPVRRCELLEALLTDPLASQAEKICGLDALLRRIGVWRERGERVVFTNGCFDLLHRGHVTLLASARREGDRLVIGLNSDRSVRALKGEGRPVVCEIDRAHVLAGLECVDSVVLFDEETPQALVETIRPDVLVKGADYSDRVIVGADLVQSWGGRVVLVPLVKGLSTTQLLSQKT
jgi:D-beta-D-heptose 7-phosphate kinase / D-beta-D-heptose 1-phosphate adenosyltransferase